MLRRLRAVVFQIDLLQLDDLRGVVLTGVQFPGLPLFVHDGLGLLAVRQWRVIAIILNLKTLLLLNQNLCRDQLGRVLGLASELRRLISQNVKIVPHLPA